MIGGGNSAGQAALLFSGYADSVTMLVRGSSLAASMSQDLVDQLAAKSNVHIETGVEVVGVEGHDSLEAIEVAAGPSRRRERRPSDGLFILIGGRAETSWLVAGDVRHGSVKRVSAGVGEGSMAIAVVHQYLAELRAGRRIETTV